MTPESVMSTFQQSMLVAIQLAAPVLLVSIGVGLVIAIFQAATQINEQTISFVPKLLAIVIVLLGLGTWMMTMLSEFMEQIFRVITGL